MSSYSNVVRGKLSFKGDKARGSSSTVKSSSANGSNARKDESSSSLIGNKRNREEQEEDHANSAAPEIQILSGVGRITSSGTVIQGHYTEFMRQLSVGDAIIITHPTTNEEETKVVRMVLSNTSIGISSAFSSDLISTTPFRYIKAPKDEEDESAKAAQVTQKKHRAEEEAFGTYASAGGSKFTYRVKKNSAFGGYKIVTESTNKELSREELLEMRAKKKSDRHCY